MPSFGLLRISILYYRENWWQHFWRVRWWWGAAIVLSILELTPFYFTKVLMVAPPNGGILAPEPVFGWVISYVELPYTFSSLLFMAVHLIRDQFSSRVRGVQRAELQFVMLAGLIVLAGVLFTPFLRHLVGNAQALQLAPLRVLILDFIIAYGITSRGILHVRAIFRLTLSYVLLALYAGLIFTVAWFFFRAAFLYLGNDSAFAPALCVAMVTTLLFNATGIPVRRFANRLLPPEIDFEKIVTDVSNIMQSVTTLEALLERFASVLGQAVGSPTVRVLLIGSEQWRTPEVQPGGKADAALCLESSDPLIAALCVGAADVAIEELQRHAPSLERDALLARMETIEVDLFVPILYQGRLSGALAIAPRPSGHLYGSTGRATLRLIARQLGVAIANAHLYTEARRSQAYNQFLVEHLPCGIIATDAVGTLTVVNPEARRLLTLDELAPPGEQDLPFEIAGLIPPTLDGDFIGRDEEIILSPGARGEVNLRVSCLPFTSERQELLGAVLMLNNYTEVERLQRQVRQADRLASIGTLASGMAHEIKNPLTTLKTFTQLLPKRYQDAEFRNDFTGLVGGEILRIERIVNQLLAFARPAPLMIEQVNLHDLIDGTVRLVSPQAARQSIDVRTSLLATHDFVAADKDRLQQVLLNLMLNAIQASEDGSWIELATENEEVSTSGEPMVRLDVRDAGRGISKDLLPHIFDPFFTTKNEGTGLGLSVSYNIIAEHKGRIEVRSEPGKGTCFSIYLRTC